MQSVAPRMIRTPGQVRHAGKSMGEDNEAAYGDELGLSKDEFQRLATLRVI